MRWYRDLLVAARHQLEEAARQATRLQRELAAQEDARALTQLAQLGVQLVLPQEMDLTAFHDRVQPIRRQLESQLPSALVDAYLRT